MSLFVNRFLGPLSFSWISYNLSSVSNAPPLGRGARANAQVRIS